MSQSDNTCRLYPMILSPCGKGYLWGGQRLNEVFDKRIDMDPLAETWECSTHPDGPSVIANGEYRGYTLQQLIEMYPQMLGTNCGAEKTLPILVKFIDAKQQLSVQVHPDDEYAREHEDDMGKTEMWYIIDAEPDAEIIYGFEHPVNPGMLYESVKNGTMEKHLHKIKVKRGDSFFIPAGTIHAIGAGLLIAEIQESSNVTYRVYDYDRVGRDGKKRDLHIEKAVEVLDMKPVRDISARNRLTRYKKGVAKETLCRCDYFTVDRIACVSMTENTVDSGSFQVILCLDGELDIMTARFSPVTAGKGTCVFLPAQTGNTVLSGRFDALRISV